MVMQRILDASFEQFLKFLTDTQTFCYVKCTHQSATKK